MHSLLSQVSKAPLSVLPKVSLNALLAFRNGYAFRILQETGEIDWGFDNWEFHRWLCSRFQVKYAAAIADVNIVSSFYLSEEEAFHAYFGLLEEYCESTGEASTAVRSKPNESFGFEGLIRRARGCPALYIGTGSFLSLYSMLMGDQWAYDELGFRGDQDRDFFKEFQKWIEIEHNKADQERRWFKIIEFWSFGDRGAYDLFFQWLDDFCKVRGLDRKFEPIELRKKS